MIVSTLRMTLDDVLVANDQNGADEIYVASRHGTAAYMWPPRVEHKGIKYRFHANEPMTGELANYYGGYAKYVRDDELTIEEPLCIDDVEDEDEYDAPRVQGVSYLRLCESIRVALRPDRLYYFTVDKYCPKCVALAKAYK